MYVSDNDRVNTFIMRLCDNAYVIRVLKSMLSMHDRYNMYVYICINTPTYVQCTIPNNSIKVYILICTLKESCLIYKTGSKQRHPVQIVVNKKNIFISHESLYKSKNC